MDSVAKVLLADDHALYREGLAELFGKWDDFEVVGEAENGLEAVEFCRNNEVDLVLMDVKMPVMDGVEATGIICCENPNIAVVMLTISVDDYELFGSIRKGAKGYLLKTTHARQLHNRLQSITRGFASISDEAAARCFEFIRGHQATGDIVPPEIKRACGQLTDHEKQLLRMLAVGASNREIGERMYMGESTVKKQVSAILTKLGLENRVQAAVFALRAGLVD